MTTSAQALTEILSLVHSKGPKETRFLRATADLLGEKGKVSELEAAQVLVSLYDRIEADISSLPVNDKEKATLKSTLSKFKGLKTFAHFHLDVQNAKHNFLKSDSLVELTAIHVALKDQARQPELDSDTKNVADSLRDVAAHLAASQMPDEAKEVLSRRLLQVTSAIDHFNLFGSQGLDESLQSLLGAMALYSEGANTDEDKTLLRKTVRLVKKVTEGLKKADETISVFYSLGNKADNFIDKLPPSTFG
jgi:hypothetical protein